MMTRAPLNAFSITVAVNGLLQAPGTNYDLISGRSGLLFPEAPSSGVEIDVRHLGGLVGPSGEQGIQGVSGTDGISTVGFRTEFDSATTNSDPGNGKFKFNNSDPASATY